jgi:type I restriction enzyme S subunit
MSDLPSGWTQARLADVAEVRLGRQRSPKTAIGERMRPYLRAANVKWEGLDLSDVKEMAFTAAESETYELRPGDLLLGEASGSPSEVGKPGQYRGEIVGCCFQNTLLRVRFPDGLQPDFYEHFFREQAMNGKFAAGSRGVGIHHLGAAAMSDWQIPVAPLAEQVRIISAIEEAFSKLDAGEAGLRTVRLLLKRMRETVLNAAITGRLVPQDPADSPASGWQEWASAKDDPFALDALPGLPESWSWVRAASLCDAVECGGTPAASHMTQGSGDVPFVKVYNLTMSGALDFSVNPTFIDAATHAKQLRSAARPGDVLTNIVGPPLGKVAVVPPTSSSWNMNQAVVMFRPSAAVQSDFLAIALQTTAVHGRLAATARATAGQFNVSLTACRYLPIPVPPTPEQHRIVDEVHRQLSVIVACERAVDLGVVRSAGLRRSVLKAAFEGRLVPQDSSDEPALELLARIHAERAPNDGSSGKRRHKKVEAS